MTVDAWTKIDEFLTYTPNGDEPHKLASGLLHVHDKGTTTKTVLRAFRHDTHFSIRLDYIYQEDHIILVKVYPSGKIVLCPEIDKWGVLAARMNYVLAWLHTGIWLDVLAAGSNDSVWIWHTKGKAPYRVPYNAETTLVPVFAEKTE